MERTKGYLLFNDSRKAPQNQGFSEVSFQKGHSFSSQARYDHFDTLPYMLTRFREVNAIFSFIRIFIRTQHAAKLLICREPPLLKALCSFGFSK